MMKKREALKYFQALGKTFKMKEFRKYITKKEEIDFSLEEKDGHIVYVPGKNKLEEIPAGCILHTLNDQLVSNFGLNLSGTLEYLSFPEHYPLTLVFRSDHGQEGNHIKKKLTCPVPDNFFGEITPLTDKEIEHYTKLAQSWVKGLLDASTSDEGFEYVCTKNDVDVYQGTWPGSQLHLIRGVTRVKASKDEARALMISDTTEKFRRLFHMIDAHFQDGLVLHQFPANYKAPQVPFYSIKWAVMGSPGPVWFRDVCWLEYGDIIIDETGNELGFGVGSSITRPECPTLENYKLVRAEILSTGYVFKHRVDDPGYMDIIYVIQADPKGWIPKWAVNMFAWQQALNVSRIRKIIEGTLEAKERMSHHDRHGAEVQGVLVPHGQTHTVPIKVTQTLSRISFGFCSNHYDIGCYMSGLPADREWSKSKRFSSNVTPVNGQVLVTDVGEYTLVFDNSYSWFKSKQIYYWYHLSSNEGSSES